MSLEELRKGGYLMDESQWLRVRLPRANIPRNEPD